MSCPTFATDQSDLDLLAAGLDRDDGCKARLGKIDGVDRRPGAAGPLPSLGDHSGARGNPRPSCQLKARTPLRAESDHPVSS